MASKHIFKVRRGTRYINDDGSDLLKADGTPERNDWASYTAKSDHIDPMDGELVVEFEYNPKTKQTTPRLKIGDGTSTFAQLAYIGIESFIFPAKSTSITLQADKWEEVLNDDDKIVGFEQTVEDIDGVTQYSKVDLQPSPEQLITFSEKDMTFTTVNEGGNVKVCVVGQKPTQDYMIQVTITEVSAYDN